MVIVPLRPCRPNEGRVAPDEAIGVFKVRLDRPTAPWLELWTRRDSLLERIGSNTTTSAVDTGRVGSVTDTLLRMRPGPEGEDNQYHGEHFGFECKECGESAKMSALVWIEEMERKAG